MIDINKLSSSFKVRKIEEKDYEEVYKLMLGNPDYFKFVPPAPSISTPKEDSLALPPNKTYDDKYYLGFYKDNELIAIMDLIDKFPNPTTAFIGLFMVNSSYHRKGIGSEIIRELIEYFRELNYENIRLGYALKNIPAKLFWEFNGFKKTGIISHQELYDVEIMVYKMK